MLVSQVNIYPIKSCAGITLDSADSSATGLRHDRRWMLVDETGAPKTAGADSVSAVSPSESPKPARAAP